MTTLHNIFKTALFAGTFLFLPTFAFALTTVTNFQSFVTLIIEILGLLVPIIFALTMIVFFWGIAQFILSAGNEQKRSEGKQIMLWGIIALFVMMSVWGILKTLCGTFTCK